MKSKIDKLCFIPVTSIDTKFCYSLHSFQSTKVKPSWALFDNVNIDSVMPDFRKRSIFVISLFINDWKCEWYLFWSYFLKQVWFHLKHLSEMFAERTSNKLTASSSIDQDFTFISSSHSMRPFSNDECSCLIVFATQNCMSFSSR